MAGATTPAMVAAVANAGALGMVAAAYLTPAEIEAEIAATRRLTDRPFGVNLFVGGAEPLDEVDPGPMLEILGRYHAELGLPPPSLSSTLAPAFDEQLEAVLAAEVPIFSFTFGCPPAALLERLPARTMVIMGTATTVAEARLLAEAGVDAVVAQGSEAGAHRSTFAGPFEAAMVGTLALVPQVVDAVDVPVIAAGGIVVRGRAGDRGRGHHGWAGDRRGAGAGCGRGTTGHGVPDLPRVAHPGGL